MSEQSLIDVAYVCSIGVRGRDNVNIPAGRSFIKEALVEHSFDRLKSQGYISRFQRERPIQPIGRATGQKLSGIENETPDAAMTPPKLSEEQKVANIRAATQKVKDGQAAKAQEVADKAQAEADAKAKVAEDEAKAQEVLKNGKPATTEPKKESTVQQIWTADPELIKDVPFEQLYSQYRSRCDKCGLTPEQFDDDKELLIMQLSADFKS